MPDFSSGPEANQEIIVATIANQKNPAQVIEIIHQPDKGIFVTRGISIHFGLKEIAVPQSTMLPAIQELTGALSYLLERIATADDLKLPFRYDPEFKLENSNYLLKESEDFMILTQEE
jgi:hypothetical protein